MTVIERLKEDGAGIYIGNIFTVDSDLNLPIKGKNGSDIVWESEYPHLIANNGKVERPRAGTGNRELTLTATLTLGNESLTCEFLATILALESTVVYTRVLNIETTIAEGEAYALPSVVVLETDDGAFTTLPVQWENPPNFAGLGPGCHEIKAKEIIEKNFIAVPKAFVNVAKEVPALKMGPVPCVKAFPHRDVQVNGGIFAQNIERMQRFLLSVSDDVMLYNFRKAAGLPTKGAQPMTGWDAPECLLKGHTTGHYLSAIALACCGGVHESKFVQKVNDMITGLKECQDAMAASGKFHPGFLSGYSEEQFDLLEEYAIYPKIWAPYYTLHKIMAGLLDCYELAGNETALSICKKLGLWVHERLHACGEEKRQKMWAMYIAGEFGGMNEVMARLYGLCPQKEYLDAAKYFDNDKLFYPMVQNIDTLGGIHANQHIPQIIGALEIYKQSGDVAYYEMAKNFWHIVTKRHLYCIGGTGEGEMFQKADGVAGFLSDRTAESCASYNMLKLTAGLFTYTPSAEMMDYYENALVNHIVASHEQCGPTGGSTYFMPLEPGGVKSFDSNNNSCCHGTGLESHLRYQESIYYHSGDILYVGQYIPSKLNWREKEMEIVQETEMISTQKARLCVFGSGHVKMMLRIPAWLQEPAVIKLNGQKVNCEIQSGFAVLERDFASGDIVEMGLPFALLAEKAPDSEDVFSLRYGPLVLAAASESKGFLPWPAGKNPVEVLEKTDEENAFRWGSISLRPNYCMQNGAYHVYMKEES